MAELNLTFGNKWLNTDPLTGKFTAGEQNVDVWHITGPRMYGELDLSTLTWAMVGATEHDTIASDEMQFSTDGDSITFVWNVSAEMTALPGKLSLHMVGTQGETEVIKIASNGTIVRPSLAGAFAPQLPIAETTLNQIIANASAAAQSAQTAQTAAGQAQTAADQAQEAAESIGDAVQQAQTAAGQAADSATAAGDAASSALESQKAAAGSASAAAGSASDAAQAKTDAQTAAGQAQTHAGTAQTAATQAGESASAAAGSASAAAGDSEDAAQAKADAQTAAGQAQTAAGQAQASAEQAAESATEAEGYAGQLGTAVSDKGVFDTSAALIAAYPNGTGTEGWYASVTETSTIWNYTGGTWADTGTAIGNNYEAATNKPSINNVELSGNKTSADLGLQPAGNYAASADLAAKANKPASPTAGNLAALDGDGNLADAGTSAAALQQATAAKADKVSGATAGNFAGLDTSGNLTDSGSKAADFATPAQLEAKANRAPNPTAGHIATLDAQGNPVDSGKTLEDVTPEDYDSVKQQVQSNTEAIGEWGDPPIAGTPFVSIKDIIGNQYAAMEPGDLVQWCNQLLNASNMVINVTNDGTNADGGEVQGGFYGYDYYSERNVVQTSGIGFIFGPLKAVVKIRGSSRIPRNAFGYQFISLKTDGTVTSQYAEFGDDENDADGYASHSYSATVTPVTDSFLTIVLIPNSSGGFKFPGFVPIVDNVAAVPAKPTLTDVGAVNCIAVTDISQAPADLPNGTLVAVYEGA